MRVREFMIGLPGPSIGFTIGDTKYGVTPFLLGGYALIAGMQYDSESPTLAHSLEILASEGKIDTRTVLSYEPALGYDFENDLEQLVDWGTIHRSKSKTSKYLYEMKAGDGFLRGEARSLAQPEALLAEDRQKTYMGAKFYQRVIMLLAGAAFNLVFAIAVITAVMMFVGDTAATTSLASVTKDSPAFEAGVLAGDTITAVDGVEVDSWEELYDLIGTYKTGDVILLDIVRGGQHIQIPVTLADNNGRAFMGIAPEFTTEPVGFLEALKRSFELIWLVAVGIAGLFNPATFGDVINQSSSVVGISVEASNAASAGFLPFIFLAAALSVSIGLMNLLPLPPLDGGKILLESIQRITRRQIPIRVINSVSMLVLMLFGMLFLTVTVQDIQRYFLGG